MIEVTREQSDVSVEVAGKRIDVLEFDDQFVFCECDIDWLKGETNNKFPVGLTVTTHSEDGFGTGLFYEADLVSENDRVLLHFRCLHPNKYWEGRYGLATFLDAVANQVTHHDGIAVVEKELSEDWKQLTLERVIPASADLGDFIKSTAEELNKIIHEAEVGLAGIVWRKNYETDERLFCTEVLLPLFRRMGFLTVRYRHGVKEYGKDFTFSEVTQFGSMRHYGVQAKAGSLSGGVNAAIDEIIGQVSDAFAMPYYELGSKNPRYISTFIVVISGIFTGNAKEKIAEKIPKGLAGSVLFLDRELIIELVERYWAEK